MSGKEAIIKFNNGGFINKGELIGRSVNMVVMDDVEKRMTKFAPVAPAHIYKAMAANGYVPKQILLLAHDVVKNEKEYAEVFNSPLFAYTNIIMDNSVVELGKAVDTEMVFNAAEIVGADIVVLPDVMGDHWATIESTRKVVHDWKWRAKEKDYQLMSLIQGSSIQGWLECLQITVDEFKPGWIGIPRCAEQAWGFTRSELVDLVRVLTPVPIHLFGFSDHIWRDLIAAKHPAVTSIDSNVPIRLASSKLLYGDPGKRTDWAKLTFELDMITSCQRVDRIIQGYY